MTEVLYAHKLVKMTAICVVTFASRITTCCKLRLTISHFFYACERSQLMFLGSATKRFILLRDLSQRIRS
ncbi:hypothetical protein L2734_12250, partial [Parashewanella spongiae]